MIAKKKVAVPYQSIFMPKLIFIFFFFFFLQCAFIWQIQYKEREETWGRGGKSSTKIPQNQTYFVEYFCMAGLDFALPFKMMTSGLTSMFSIGTGSSTCNSLFGDPEHTGPLLF